MGRIWKIVYGAVYIYLAAFFCLAFMSILLSAYGKWSATNFSVSFTDHGDSIRVSWGPMRRDQFLGQSLFEGGSAVQAFFQTYPSYFAAKDRSWEGILVPDTILEHIAGRVRLLFALRAEQPAFEVREGRLYQLVAVRPTWTSGTIHRWEEKAVSGDIAWVLQQSRDYFRHYQKQHKT
jgi:hypothetical protein